MTPAPPVVRVVANPVAAAQLVLAEVRAALERTRRPLLGFATGQSQQAVLQALAAEVERGALSPRDFAATHLDEYVGFAPDRRGGMVHELVTQCAPFADMLARGVFVPVPHEPDDAVLRRHEERLQRLGGVALQLLGVGRNGHLAFHEPGVPFATGFHVATLAGSTRDDARARFAPGEPPTHAVTAGVATILAARRLVLSAFGRGKAAAVRAMLEGPVDPACPASAIRRHGDVLVLLDRDAAAECGAARAPAP